MRWLSSSCLPRPQTSSPLPEHHVAAINVTLKNQRCRRNTRQEGRPAASILWQILRLRHGRCQLNCFCCAPASGFRSMVLRSLMAAMKYGVGLIADARTSSIIPLSPCVLVPSTSSIAQSSGSLKRLPQWRRQVHPPEQMFQGVYGLFSNAEHAQLSSGRSTMAIDERRSNVERRSGKDRRSGGVDTRTEEQRQAIGERRSSIDRRSGLDRRSGAAPASAPGSGRDDA